MTRQGETPRLEAHMHTQRGSGVRPGTITPVAAETPLTAPCLHSPPIANENPSCTINVFPVGMLSRRTESDLGGLTQHQQQTAHARPQTWAKGAI